MYKYNANVIVDQIKFEQKNKDIIAAHTWRKGTYDVFDDRVQVSSGINFFKTNSTKLVSYRYHVTK